MGSEVDVEVPYSGETAAQQVVVLFEAGGTFSSLKLRKIKKTKSLFQMSIF